MIINGFKSASVTKAIQSAEEIVSNVEHPFYEQSVCVSGMLYQFYLKALHCTGKPNHS